MRYVIVITVIAFFIIWDMLYNQGVYLDRFITFLVHLLRSVGISI